MAAARPRIMRHNRPERLQRRVIQRVIPTHIIHRGLRTHRLQIIILILNTRHPIREHLLKINHLRYLIRMLRTTINNPRHLGVINHNALPSLSNPRLILIQRRTRRQLHRTIIIGHLNTTQHRAIPSLPLLPRRQNRRHRITSHRIKMTLQILNRRPLAQLLTQLRLARNPRHIRLRAKLTRRIRPQILTSRNLKTVRTGTIRLPKLRHRARGVNIPRHAIPNTRRRKRRHRSRRITSRLRRRTRSGRIPTLPRRTSPGGLKSITTHSNTAHQRSNKGDTHRSRRTPTRNHGLHIATIGRISRSASHTRTQSKTIRPVKRHAPLHRPTPRIRLTQHPQQRRPHGHLKQPSLLRIRTHCRGRLNRLRHRAIVMRRHDVIHRVIHIIFQQRGHQPAVIPTIINRHRNAISQTNPPHMSMTHLRIQIHRLITRRPQRNLRILIPTREKTHSFRRRNTPRRQHNDAARTQTLRPHLLTKRQQPSTRRHRSRGHKRPPAAHTNQLAAGNQIPRSTPDSNPRNTKMLLKHALARQHIPRRQIILHVMLDYPTQLNMLRRGPLTQVQRIRSKLPHGYHLPSHTQKQRRASCARAH